MKFLALCLREVSIKGPFLPTCGFANQGKSLVMCSFPIPPIFEKKKLSFLHFKVWRCVYFFGCLATHFLIEKKFFGRVLVF